MFLLSIAMMLICVATVMVGVYSPFYSNGGVFMFFLALINLYIFDLVFLSWPSSIFEELSVEEIEMKEDVVSDRREN